MELGYLVVNVKKTSTVKYKSVHSERPNDRLYCSLLVMLDIQENVEWPRLLAHRVVYVAGLHSNHNSGMHSLYRSELNKAPKVVIRRRCVFIIIIIINEIYIAQVRKSQCN